MVPLADGFDYARRLGAPLRVIADCGHLLVGERPGACADAIESFLDRIGDLEELPLEPELAG
jgi:pimeloyl-ACP methyl ester carboxylesterase